MGCGKKGLTGRTGEAISLNTEIAEDSDDLDYNWIIADQPDASMLSLDNFSYNENRSTVSFIPDAPGDYILQVEVLQYGDEIAIQSFAIAVEQGDAVPVEQTKPNWYEEESDRQWFEADTIVGDTVVEVPVITEVAPAIDNVEEIVAHIPKNEGRFTIQVVSKKLLSDAEVVAAKLINSGFDAYIQKAYFIETDEVWFRVRVGSYDSRKTALTVAKSISESRGTSTWVDYVRYEE